ncbi:hypothetical protein C8F04DRAFT_1329177 [Mycena alexandri]|uniref:Novel STAND NTPase 1 domain-containing protein n=1 Tax=Mycena alexandri TaxID=1745969 RepID=A0AAD6S1I9_9AGAR|nr:hypothetical protein C8F04DRAFT_1329177 [Mycena alexandri]
MPRQPTITEVRLNDLSKCLAITTNTFDVLVHTLKISGLEAISNTTQSLLGLVQTVKQNKDECTELMEYTHELLKAIIGVYIKSDTGPELPPSMLNEIAKFMETLHKIHTYVEAQQSGSKIKKFFRQGELSVLLKDCKAGLQKGLDFFNVKTADIMTNVREMQDQAQLRHQEMLNMIEDLLSSDSASSISKMYSSSYASSNSISMLPPEPKIFHGRDSELTDILVLFRQGTPRIAILGAGGMGKTSLARIVVHHEEITTKYRENRFFVACDTASSKAELAGLIGTHLGMKPGKDLTRAVLKHFSNSPPTLLILDNLETVWESAKSRKGIEEFLSLLTDIMSLALMAYHDAWSGKAIQSAVDPAILTTLKSLAQDAAQEMFADITDNKHPLKEVDQVLSLTDNMPLSISLLAHLVDLEGCPEILSRWETEKTSLISEGYDKRSNLELSISISLSSPRIASMPQSLDLLALLSMLPDGLSDVELKQTKFPIKDIRGCKVALLCTALAYIDGHKHLKVLVPIREYMGKLFPPAEQMIQPLLKYFYELLKSSAAALGTPSGAVSINRITSNYTNIHNVLQTSIQKELSDPADVIYCTCEFNRFSLRIGRGATLLLEDITNLLPSLEDHRLKAYLIAELVPAWGYHPTSHLDSLIVEALDHFKYFDDTDLEGLYYFYYNPNTSVALHHTQTALSLAQANNNLGRQCDALNTLGEFKTISGDHVAGRAYAHEAQRLAKISGDMYKEARALYNEALCLRCLGEYQECIALTTRGRLILGLCGLSPGELNSGLMQIQAEVRRLKSEYVEAHNIQNQILQNTVTDNHEQAASLLNIAEIEVLMGVLKTEIQKKIDASQAIFGASNQAMLTIACDTIQADLNLREGDLSSTLFCKCLQLGWGTYSDAVTYCLERLADINRWEGCKHPTSWPAIFLAHSLKAKEQLGIHQALQFMGDVFLKENDESTAFSLFTLALEGFTQMDVHRSRAECMIRLGDLSNKHGDLLRALELWETARRLFDRSSQAKRVQDIDERLVGIGEDVKEQHKINLAQLTELNAHTGKLEEVEEGLSEDELENKEARLIAA